MKKNGCYWIDGVLTQVRQSCSDFQNFEKFFSTHFTKGFSFSGSKSPQRVKNAKTGRNRSRIAVIFFQMQCSEEKFP